jgi:hypothetical protein
MNEERYQIMMEDPLLFIRNRTHFMQDGDPATLPKESRFFGGPALPDYWLTWE